MLISWYLLNFYHLKLHAKFVDNAVKFNYVNIKAKPCWTESPDVY